MAVLSRNDPDHSVTLPAERGRVVLEVLVENQGRINFGAFIGDRKGITGARLGRRRLHSWTSRALPVDRPGLVEQLDITAPGPGGPGPQFARTIVEIDSPADGFIALPDWDKGFVWLNGVLLGRYWSLGPQVTLYAAGPLWRPGANEIVVLELHEPGSVIEIRAEPDLGPVTMFGGEAP